MATDVTNIVIHFTFHIRFYLYTETLRFSVFSAFLCVTFLSAGIVHLLAYTSFSIIIIIFVITFTQDIYNYIPETSGRLHSL